MSASLQSAVALALAHLSFYTVIKSVETMRSLNLKAGKKVSVANYYLDSVGGGSDYIIKDASVADEDGDIYSPTTTGNILLDNGNVAVLQIDNATNADNFGARPGIDIDNEPMLSESITALKGLRLGAGDYQIENTLFLKSDPDNLWLGQGATRSRLKCVNMAGQAAISYPGAGAFIRVVMRDYGVFGDCDRALDLDVPEPFQVFSSEFTNLRLESVSEVIKSQRIFSTVFNTVQTFSESSNGFDIVGGPGTTLINCYAHEVGVGGAGYRLSGTVTLLGCNGIDAPINQNVWGRFGDLSSGRAYNITMIGCNVEDFDQQGIELENFGALKLQTTTFVPKASGNYRCSILAINGGNHEVDIDQGVSLSSKGATKTGEQEIIADSGVGAIYASVKSNVNLASDTFSKYYRTSQTLTYENDMESVGDSIKYGVNGRRFKALQADNNYSFNTPPRQTLGANDENPDVTGKNVVKTNNGAPTNVQTAPSSNEQDGRELVILIGDNNTTIKHNIASAKRFILKSGADETPSQGDVYSFIYVQDTQFWVQV